MEGSLLKICLLTTGSCGRARRRSRPPLNVAAGLPAGKWSADARGVIQAHMSPRHGTLYFFLTFCVSPSRKNTEWRHWLHRLASPSRGGTAFSCVLVAPHVRLPRIIELWLCRAHLWFNFSRGQQGVPLTSPQCRARARILSVPQSCGDPAFS